MPVTCIVVNCGSRADRDGNVKFYAIPKELNYKFLKHKNQLSRVRRAKWLAAIKRDDLTATKIAYQRVCSKHFITGKPASLTDADHPDWIPTQNLGHTSIILTKKEGTLARSERVALRRKKLSIAASTSMDIDVQPDNHLQESICEKQNEDETGVHSQTDMSFHDIDKLLKDCDFTNEKLKNIQTTLTKLSITFESLVIDNVKCQYYTGLSAKLLILVYDSIKDRIPSTSTQVLSPSSQLILTFIKLRLNLAFKDLAYRFGVSTTTASAYFYTLVDLLYDSFKNFIIWPDREHGRKNIPKCFKNAFQERTTVIIDCFEVFIEKPTNMLTYAQCWSNYKHHHTVKFLIGITPQGTVSYISEAWGGRASDKQITEFSNFLNHITPGDVVLADRGFLIKDSLGIRQAKLAIPAFTKGVSQLHPLDIEETRNIAHVRIHVERVIGLIKTKFKILGGTLPISMIRPGVNNVSMLDKVVTICCAFINICPPIIPLK